MDTKQKIRVSEIVFVAISIGIAFITLLLDMSGGNVFFWVGCIGGGFSWAGVMSLFEILLAISAIALAVFHFIPKFKNKAFGTIAISLALATAFIFFLINLITDGMGYYVSDILFLPYMINLGLFIAYMVVHFKNKEKTPTGNFGKMYCTIGRYVLLSIVTFGIWTFIWTYRVTKFLNEAPNHSKSSPGGTLALCMFVPFYQIYWFYKQGKKADDLAKSIGLRVADIGKTCLIGAFFFTMVVPALIQGRINDVCVYSVENTL